MLVLLCWVEIGRQWKLASNKSDAAHAHIVAVKATEAAAIEADTAGAVLASSP